MKNSRKLKNIEMIYMTLLKSKIIHSNIILNIIREIKIAVGSFKINILCP